MMTFDRIKQNVLGPVIGLALGASMLPTAQAEMNFDEVGRQVSFLLKNVHYSKEKFDDKMSQRFLDTYLKSLDPGKIYFTQEDIAKFEKNYGATLAADVVDGDSMKAGEAIYAVFRKRLDERLTQARELLAKNEFDFTKERSLPRSRKDVEWPKNDAEARQLWADQIAQQVLSEKLRRDAITKLAKEQGKENPVADDDPINEMVLRRLERVERAVEDTDKEEIANYFYSSLAKSFDPHTEYFSHRELERFMSAMGNSLIGVGAMLQEEDDGATKITGIVVGGPADKQGELGLGDRIVAVDPDGDGPKPLEDIMFMKIDKVVELIRGKKGTNVKLKVEPNVGGAGETKFIEIKRDRVEMKDELANAELIRMKQPDGQELKLGFLTFPSFYADFKTGENLVSDHVEVLLRRLVKEGMDGLVLDLRNNGGGSLQEVKRMTAFFTGGGPVVQIRDTRGRTKVLTDDGDAIYKGPMVVLTNSLSASASEILAGALQDYNRAVIVGDESTYGKGTVQQPFELAEWMPVMKDRARAGALKATIQKFYRVAGSSTQLKGVESDIVIPSLMSAFELGESHTDNPLEWDQIAPADGFKPGKRELLHIEELKQLSQKRRAEMKDLQYLVEDINRAKQQIKENSLSLNQEVREAEAAEAEARRKQRNLERRKRYANQEKWDAENLKVFRLKLDDVDRETLVEVDRDNDKDSYMKREKSETEDLDDSPEYPSLLDPVKRESLRILTDLIDLQAGRKAQAHVLPKSAE